MADLKNNPDLPDSSQIAIGKNIAQAWGPNASANVTVYEFAPPAPVDADTLAAAEQRLAGLPLDGIPPVAALPHGSRMPLSPNPHFVGREDEFKDLARLLKTDQTTVINQVAATGLGGIGKSQLAAAFAHRYGHYFAGGVFWLSLADPAAVPTEVALCGGPMNLRPDFGQLKIDEQVTLVLSAWQSPLPRLLIFDNCEDENLLTRWRPPTGGCRVLLTSRRSQWSLSLGVQSLPLPTLPRNKSIELLRKFRPNLAQTAAGDIAAELGGLPLALHLAGSFLARYRRITPEQYLADLRATNPLAHPALTGRGAGWSPTGHELHVAQTFALSFDDLKPAHQIDTLARQLLARAACFAPGEPIPRDLLLATIEMESEDVAPSEEEGRGGAEYSSLDLDDALHRLATLGLLDPTGDDEAVTLHRLLAAFVNQVGPDPESREAVEAALLAEANRLNNAGYPAPLLAWQPHLRHVANIARRRDDETAAGLCNTLGYHLNMVGEYEAARPYYERALAIFEKVLGPEHPATAGSLNNLGALLDSMGEYEAARPYYERALAISEKGLGPEHPDTALSLNNLGVLLQAMGEYEAARPYYERALAIWEKGLGPEHPATAQSLNNLGVLLQAMGEYEAARPYYERALAIREKGLGPEHPATAQSLNNLGFLLQAMGEYEAARPYYERALAIREKGLGPEHPDTAQSLNNLGFLLQAMGEYEAARPYSERALAIWEKGLGPEHPDTALSLNNLGFLLQAMGEYEAARPYFERALAIWEKGLGPEHPDTALSLNNLGALLQAMGEYEAARPYYERALAIWEKGLGPEHPDTALSLNNLGVLLQAMGEYEAARPYFERALAIREKVLGPEHPDTARSLNNLGALLQAMGEYEAARPYYERALAIREKGLGPEHPDTALSLNNLGALIRAMGEYEAARPYYERALAIREKGLGPEHPDTARSYWWMGVILRDEGNLAGARPYFERALTIYEAKLGSTHQTTQSVRRMLQAL